MASALQYYIPFGWDQCTEKVQFARDRGHGLEIGVFASREGVSDPIARRDYERRISKRLHRFPGPFSMHGAFIDLAVHSDDTNIARYSRDCIFDDVRLATRLGCQKVVFHTGYNPLIPARKYREIFYSAQIDFWRQAAAVSPELTICLENQWENDPAILLELMQGIDRPNVRVCLDVGHAHAYSKVPAVDWLRLLTPFLAHMHWNDNLGDTDSHLPIGEGSLEWAAILRETQRLMDPVSIVIELNSLTAIQQSLAFLEEQRFEEVLSTPVLPWRSSEF